MGPMECDGDLTGADKTEGFRRESGRRAHAGQPDPEPRPGRLGENDSARAIADSTTGSTEEIIWPWKHMMQRLKSGWDTSPGGVTALEVRQLLTQTVRDDTEFRQLAADVLAGLGERGYLLALQAEKGPQSMVVRDTLRNLNIKSQ